MKKILITGANRVAGANLAAVLASQFQVTATSPTKTTIAGCQNLTCQLDETLAAQHLLATVEPDVVVHCGAIAEGAWNTENATAAEKLVVHNLCRAADNLGCRFVLVSGDQVYRGPWMFHSESSDCLATSSQAKTTFQCEKQVLELEDALVLRTHILGWSPNDDGFVESALAQLEDGEEFGFAHFATPISATRFADIVVQAIEQELTGTYNVGGAERCSEFGVAAALATEFELAHPIARDADTPAETTMRSSELRSRLFVTLPTLREIVAELFEEQEERTAAFAGIRKLSAAA